MDNIEWDRISAGIGIGCYGPRGERLLRPPCILWYQEFFICHNPSIFSLIHDISVYPSGALDGVRDFWGGFTPWEE